MAVLQSRAANVNIREVNLASSLTNNSTAAAAMVVVSSKGPTTPTRFSNANDFITRFGNPDSSVSFDHYCALHYFKEGNDLWATRAVGSDAMYSAAAVYADANGEVGIVAIDAGLDDPENPSWADYVDVGEETLFVVYAKDGPGSYGDNIAIKLTSSNLIAPTDLDGTSSASGGTLADGSHQYVVSALSKTGESLASSSDTVVISGGGGTAKVTLTWTAVEGATGYKIYKYDTTDYGLLDTIGAASATYVDTGDLDPDLESGPYTAVEDQPAASPRFTIDIYDLTWSTTTPRESFECSMTDETDETGAQMEVTARLNPFSQYVSCRVNAGVVNPYQMRSTATYTALTGGDSGTAPTSSDVNNAWDLFLNKELYVVDVLINGGRTSVAVQQNMEEVARTRGDCVAFLDLPATKQAYQSALDYRNIELNLDSSFASLFGPDLRDTDPITGKILFVPPSGYMAALYARTARVGAPWFSMAGLNRGVVNVLDIRYNYDEGESTALYRAQINYMRKFVGKSIALWEQTTLSSASSALQFLNVRQLLNILKRSMYDYLLYGLQEQNDEILRRQIKVGLSQYLDSVQVGRGISKYEINISNALNTPAYVNSGIMRIAIIIWPILAVRGIELVLGVAKEGITLSESEIAAL